MDNKYKRIMIIAIITSIISMIVPIIGIANAIMIAIIYGMIKDNDNINLKKKDNEEILNNLKIEVEKKEKELKNIEECSKLKTIKLEELKKQHRILNEIVRLNETKENLKFRIEESTKELNRLNEKSKHLNEKISLSNEVLSYIELEKELYTFQVGIFEKKYDYELSEEYNFQLKLNRDKQKELIKNKLVINIKEDLDYFWNSNINKSEKNKLINNLCKLVLRAFNNESDIIINKLTISNMSNSRKKLESAMIQINKLVQPYNIEIKSDFFKLKIEELQLQYEYLVKIQEEREEQREIKEKMREEAKIQAEIEKTEKEAQKEEKIYQKALEKVKSELEKANDEEKEKLQIQIKKLEENLKLAEEKMQRAKSMAQQTKSGYVYVISNIGSFGENVYKIGLTRRLEPLDRIRELSDASVPFKFDVHAMIYSNDAPALEKKLHDKFNKNRLNKVNLRKEFFKVNLNEIENVVNNELDGKIKFTKMAEALEYRQSVNM